jgi:5'-3' exonuclease
MKYIIVDLANLYFRTRHAAHRGATAEEKMALSIHVALASVNKCWRELKAEHAVFALEGRSWRKDFYKPYKANRAAARAALTPKEQEEEKVFWETFEDLQKFLTEKTNCTVLQNPRLEGDDLIAGWIQAHPDDEHVIISTDSDFHQLLAKNVVQYNGVTDELHTLEGIFNNKGKAVLDKKTKLPKKIPDPKFILFEKCLRGDAGDNVFSAYPGVRTKGSKNKVGIIEAFEDRLVKGYSYNNMMLQRWTDHEGVEHRVMDDFERNRQLIDLTAQPEEIRTIINETVAAQSVKKSVAQIGLHFMKFCAKYDLTKLSENAQAHTAWLSSGYK